MEAYHILLIAAALGVVATDALVRLRVAPERRDNIVDELLGVFVQTDVPRTIADTEPQSNTVADSLLKHFQQSFASRHIVRALVEAPHGLNVKELEDTLNEIAKRSGKNSLPSSAIRKVAMILMGAGFVKLTDGRFEMTELGWALHSMLRPTGRRQLADRSFA